MSRAAVGRDARAGAWRGLGLALVVAWLGAACDENFDDVYLGPQGGAAGMSGSSGQGGGTAGASGGAGVPACQVGRCDLESGTMVAVPCVQGRYDLAARESCRLGCQEGACVVVTQVAAGDAHSCAALSDGTVWCWGANDQGQLGQGDALPGGGKPVQVMGVSDVRAIAVSGATSCALDTKGNVRCWGANDHAQTSSPGGLVALSPVTVPLKKPAQRVALGASHGCALLDDSSVACWGRGQVGQLGEGHAGSEFQNPLPAAVTGLDSKKILDLALGGDRSCVVLAGGSVACWGAVLASGGVFAGSASPTPVTSLTLEASAIATSSDSMCVLASGGLVLCAGANTRGQLGQGNTDSTNSFVLVQGGDGKTVGDAEQISIGLASGCLRQSGSVLCWGDNASGQLGQGAGALQTRARVVNELGSGAVSVVVGRAHACAIILGGREVQCWGANDAGQTGQGAPSPSSAVGSVVW